MSTTAISNPDLSALIAKEVRAQLAYDADCAICSPITEVFSFFLMKPAFQQTYRNFKTWRFTKQSLSKSNKTENINDEATVLAGALDHLLSKNVEDLRKRMYFSKKMKLQETITGLSAHLKGLNESEKKAAIKKATEVLKTLRTRSQIRLGYSLIQLACKITFAVGAVFAVMTPLSWIGLPILGSAIALSLIVWGINRLALDRGRNEYDNGPKKRPPQIVTVVE